MAWCEIVIDRLSGSEQGQRWPAHVPSSHEPVPAAVVGDDLTGHVVGGVARQINRETDEVVRLGAVPHGDARGDRLLESRGLVRRCNRSTRRAEEQQRARAGPAIGAANLDRVLEAARGDEAEAVPLRSIRALVPTVVE